LVSKILLGYEEALLPKKLEIQQGLEIRGFWFQEKTVQLKTVLREVYNYVLNEIFFQKTVYLQGFCSKSMFREDTPMY
jgi:hypothetical protein